MIIIHFAKKEDALEIAKIHKAEISKGFLSSLSDSFLETFYLSIIDSKEGFCIVSKDSGKVVGFVAGVFDINEFYSNFFKKYFLKSFFVLFKRFFSIHFLKKLFETLLYPRKEKDLPKAELLTLAVKSQFQGRGIASQMFAKFAQEMKNKNVKYFKVLVGEGLAPAIKFYEKNGFKFVKNTKVHGDKNSRIYIFNV